MKIRTSARHHDAGAYSRNASSFFQSSAFLDKPLPTARTIGRHLLAAAEPALAPLYWAALTAKSALEDERANREARP